MEGLTSGGSIVTKTQLLQILRNRHITDPARWAWVVPAGLVGFVLARCVPEDRYRWATAVFYSFSTIAQTLAALFGVLAAFTFFRYSAIDAELSQLASRAVQELIGRGKAPSTELHDAITARVWDSVENLVRPDRHPDVPELSEWHARISDHVSRFHSLRGGLLDSLRPTFEAIFAALLLLPLASLLAMHVCLCLPVLAIVVAMALRALWGFQPVVRTAMGYSIWGKMQPIRMFGDTLTATATVRDPTPPSSPAR
jgi:hypothetical protein